jgi:hypothetical protein
VPEGASPQPPAPRPTTSSLILKRESETPWIAFALERYAAPLLRPHRTSHPWIFCSSFGGKESHASSDRLIWESRRMRGVLDHVGISCQGVRHHDITWFSLCLPCDSQPVDFLIEMIYDCMSSKTCVIRSLVPTTDLLQFTSTTPVLGIFHGRSKLKRVPLDRDCVGATVRK